MNSPVHVTTSYSSSSVLSETEHQKHVLQQYSLNQLKQSADWKSASTDVSQLTPRSQALHDLQTSWSGRENHAKQEPDDITSLSVPTPQLQLTEMWDSKKSVPALSPSQSVRPHSCQWRQLDEQMSKLEPHMPPPIPYSCSSLRTPSPFSINNTTSMLPTPSSRPILYDAWTVPKPNSATKHSKLTSSRLK